MSGRLESVNEWEPLARKANFEPEALAALCGVSLRHLERFFRRRFGITPRRWLRQLQCQQARELLARGYSTKAAAAELKFGSSSSFCRQFKKVHMVPPQHFAPPPRSMSLLDNDVVFGQSFAVEPPARGVGESGQSQKNAWQRTARND